MRKGMVQEEILFMIFPEFLFSRTILSKMEWNEALVITGVKRFANYAGYMNKTKFTGK